MPGAVPPRDPGVRVRGTSLLRRLPLLLAGLAGAWLLSLLVRRSLGFELEVESIRAWVHGFGWKAPLVYVGIVTFRHLLLLPSVLMLAAGGLVFGTLVGGALGALGLLLTGVIEFSLLRTLRPAALVERARRDWRRLARALERGAPLAVLLSTAIPPLPHTAFHCAAAFTTISFASYLLAAALGSLVRSFALSYFGAGLGSGDPLRLLAGAAVLALLVAVPFLHPGLRERLLPSEERAAP